MQTDEKLNKQIPCEDALVAIGDIAVSGNILQGVVASGIASGRVALACGELFNEIAEIAGAAERTNAGSDT